MADTMQPVILTTDIGRLETFYTKLLAAKVELRIPSEGDPFYISLSIGDSLLGISTSGEGAGRSGQRMLLSVSVTDPDSLLERVPGLGGTVEGPAKDMPWGQRVGHLRDPDGNAVNLTLDQTDALL